MFELRSKTKWYCPPGKWFYGPTPLPSGISWASDPPTLLEFPIPSVVGVWIFSGTTHWSFFCLTYDKIFGNKFLRLLLFAWWSGFWSHLRNNLVSPCPWSKLWHVNWCMKTYAACRNLFADGLPADNWGLFLFISVMKWKKLGITSKVSLSNFYSFCLVLLSQA